MTYFRTCLKTALILLIEHIALRHGDLDHLATPDRKIIESIWFDILFLLQRVAINMTGVCVETKVKEP